MVYQLAGVYYCILPVDQIFSEKSEISLKIKYQ